jgi:mRNA interferase RelE/StbE
LELWQRKSLPAAFRTLIFMPKLIVHARAARYIERMDVRIKKQLIAKLESLARNPGAMPGVKPMAGEWAGFHRLRHGDLRVIFLHDRPKDAIIVAHVGPRGDAYK